MASFEFGTVGIPLASIHEGVNEFQLDVPLSEPIDGINWSCSKNIKLNVEVQTTGDDFLVRMTVEADVDLICDRCAETFSRKINGKVQTLFTSGSTEGLNGEGGDLRSIDVSANTLDLSQEMIDGLQFGIPEKILCDSTCRGLCPHCGVNLNETSCQCQDDQTDPRWEALKNIRFDDS